MHYFTLYTQVKSQAREHVMRSATAIVDDVLKTVPAGVHSLPSYRDPIA